MSTFFLENDLAQKIFAKLEQVDRDVPIEERKARLFYLFNIVVEELTIKEQIGFNTLFSRVAFLGVKFKLDSKLLHYLHVYRRYNEQSQKTEDDTHYQCGLYAISQLIVSCSESALTDYLKANTSIPALSFPDKVVKFYKSMNGVVTSLDQMSHILSFIDNRDGLTYEVLYNITGRNEIFTSVLEKLSKFCQLPVAVNLIDVEVNEEGQRMPAAFVIEPDYLVDVTSIAELFDSSGVESMRYLLRKFMPVSHSKGLLLGNIANFLLDELMSNPDLTLKELYAQIFSKYPMVFALYGDDFVTNIIQEATMQFDNLKKVVQEDLPGIQVHPKDVYLEPSFYDPRHGLQGRLDILHVNKEGGSSDIIELKSGSVFRPNVYGLNNNHYTQTLLYDLIIQSVFEKKYKASNYILYSKQKEKPLRYAPSVRSQQIEALAIRNQIIMIENSLIKDDQDLLELIHPKNFPDAKAFIKDNIESFYNTYKKLDELNRKYFQAYVRFLAREHHLSKTGQHGVMSRNGLASLWLETLEQKEEAFSILKNLVIIDNQTASEHPVLTLQKTTDTNPLANFRKGDIVILYPYEDSLAKPTRNQVFKCTIIKMESDRIDIRLRARQTNQKIFGEYEKWNLEPDQLDSSFNGMYRNMFLYAQSSAAWKELWMCKRAPVANDAADYDYTQWLTTEQNQILNEMIHTKDYYLLWGPPGTGKTSRMLMSFVRHLHDHSKERVLLLAYTNRAVDEICAAVESIDLAFKDKYLRIGSRYSCGEEYKERLLDAHVSKLNKRQEVKDLLLSKQFYIATISSVISRSEIFELLKFDTVIIDEASQILDPMLSGFLNRFKRFFLIGDHQQIPAVVAQDSNHTIVQDEALVTCGISDLRNSLFERLYRQCEKNKWDWAIGNLSQQGRMHIDLMEFPNQQFYRSTLLAMPGIDRLTAERIYDHCDRDLSRELAGRRKIYIPSVANYALNFKTNKNEAEIVGKVVKEIVALYRLNKLHFSEESIGVITPYRAQIAQISAVFSEILEADPTFPMDQISVDTVERYQGSSREVIVFSFCTNQVQQLHNLISLSNEGVDRKLNVALTRAKEQIILVGNKEILSENPVYKELIYSYDEINVPVTI